MTRFEIQHEFDDEPVCICDTATDPDNDACEIIQIAAHFGTPQARHRLAKRIAAYLTEMAATGEEDRW